MRRRIFAEETRKWFTLAAVSFGLFMIMLDNTVVNVALPAIQSDLGADLSELQWVVAGYALTFAALMLIGGKVADAYGRRLIFVVGIAIFTSASLWCGLADSGEELIAARVLQGAGAALMNPATLSIIAATFPAHQRGMAIGIWAGVSALALAIGPLVGGLITEHVALELDLLRQRAGGRARDRGELPLHRRVARRDPRAARPPGPRDLGHRPLRAHLRPHRGEHVRLDVDAHPRRLRRRGRDARRLRPPRAPPAGADAPARALPLGHVHRRQPRRAARRARDVRRLLLRLALHAERARLLGRADRRSVPAADDPDHPDRADRGEDERPDRLARPAHRRDDPHRRPAPVLLDARRRRVVLEPPAGLPRRRRRHGADDDAERGRGHAQRSRGQGRRGLPPSSTPRGRWAARSASR